MILEDLPEWFGIAAAREAYIAAAARLPMLVARLGGPDAAGFLSLEQRTPLTAEAHVLGILRRHHRQGIGRALFQAADAWLAAQGVRWLTVKTLAATHPDPHYRSTRRFYEAIGFEPLEVLPDLWGKGLPCLVMVRMVESSG